MSPQKQSWVAALISCTAAIIAIVTVIYTAGGFVASTNAGIQSLQENKADKMVIQEINGTLKVQANSILNIETNFKEFKDRVDEVIKRSDFRTAGYRQPLPKNTISSSN